MAAPVPTTSVHCRLPLLGLDCLRLVFRILLGEMMTDGASADCANDRVVTRIVPGDAANHSTLEATRSGCGTGSNEQRNAQRERRKIRSFHVSRRRVRAKKRKCNGQGFQKALILGEWRIKRDV